MAQHDFVIDNQTFPNFRTDLNNAWSAIVSQSSGGSAPSTTYAYQLWYDSGNNILKIRNADNDAWISLFTFDQTADTAEVSAGGGAGFFQGDNGTTGDSTNGKKDLRKPGGRRSSNAGEKDGEDEEWGHHVQSAS